MNEYPVPINNEYFQCLFVFLFVKLMKTQKISCQERKIEKKTKKNHFRSHC